MQVIVHSFVHILPGLIALAIAGGIVLRVGGPREKQVMTAVLICWLLATCGQVLSGGRIEFLIAGDVVFALWLLWFAVRASLRWVYLLLALDGCRLVLHAVMYEPGQGPTLVYRLINNALSLGALAVLAAFALRGAAARRRAQETERLSS